MSVCLVNCRLPNRARGRRSPRGWSASAPRRPPSSRGPAF